MKAIIVIMIGMALIAYACRKSNADGLKTPVTQQLNLPQQQQISPDSAEQLPYANLPYNHITVSKRQLSAMIQILEANPTCQKFRITPYDGGTLIEGYNGSQDIPIPKFVIPICMEDPDGLCPDLCD